MKYFRIAFRRETAAPVLALLFASGVSAALVFTRIIWTGRLLYGFLLWNLFLAWLPLVFALLACDEQQNPGRQRWRFFGFAAAWLLFLPNASYIFTDLIHLRNHYYFQFWIDLTLILLCAVTGLVTGFVSLYQMHGMVTQWRGRLAGWLFAAAAAELSGLGVFLGRFLRFNSWDVFVKPADVYQSVGNLAADPLAAPISFVFPLLFGAFLFTVYLMLYALTHLSPVPLTQRAEFQGA